MEGVAVNTALPVGPNRKLYNAGSDWQKETGFYSTQYREYDPALGRFHAIDPMAGSFATWTPYMHGYNDPQAARVSVADQMHARNAVGEMVYNMMAADPVGGAIMSGGRYLA
ncbi:MAG: RHS repeat-associated core domain-containing protein, partial [Cyclobacteriaceae bacterium]